MNKRIRHIIDRFNEVSDGRDVTAKAYILYNVAPGLLVSFVICITIGLIVTGIKNVSNKQPEVGQCYLWRDKDCSQDLLLWEQYSPLVERVEEVGKRSVKTTTYVYNCDMTPQAGAMGRLNFYESLHKLKSSTWEKKVPCPL